MYVHGFSTRKQGDMRKSQSREAFLTSLVLDPRRLVLAQQVHGDKLAIVTSKDWGREIGEVDGLVSSDQTVTLGMRIADCVPLLLVDPSAHVIGAAHAGWRGTLAGIGKNVVDTMKTLGAQPKDILVFIGPHIGMCCYDVPEERSRLFLKTFHNEPKVASLIEGKWHLDLGYANFLTLIESGISRNHIHAPPVCTSCQVDTFFSYRRDQGQARDQRILGVIGYAT